MPQNRSKEAAEAPAVDEQPQLAVAEAVPDDVLGLMEAVNYARAGVPFPADEE